MSREDEYDFLFKGISSNHLFPPFPSSPHLYALPFKFHILTCFV